MTQAMQLEELMTRDVKTIDSGASIHDAAKMMKVEKIGSLIVTEDGKHIGILTERDILKKVVAANERPVDVKVDEIMAFPLTTLNSYVSVREAVEKMSDLGFRRMPITDNGRLVGIVCDRDIFREAPYLMSIFNKSDEEDGDEQVSERGISGRCDDCGAYSYDIAIVDGVYLCHNCR